MTFLTNPWVVGILSGLIVAVITRLLFSGRSKARYRQSVYIANKDIVQLIKAGLSEDWVPNRNIISALIESSARKNSVQESDLYSVAEIGEELIREVLDTSFITSQKKNEYCEKILKTYVAQEGEVSEGMRRASWSSSDSNQRVAFFSVYAGLLTGLSATVVGLMGTDSQLTSLITSLSNNDVLPLFVTVLASLLAVMIAFLAAVSASKERKKGLEQDANVKADTESLYFDIEKFFSKKEKSGD